MRNLLIICIAILILGACDNTGKENLPRNLTSGLSDDRILIGSSLALNGHAGYLGTQTMHGALAYLNHINAGGGY